MRLRVDLRCLLDRTPVGVVLNSTLLGFGLRCRVLVELRLRLVELLLCLLGKLLGFVHKAHGCLLR